MSDGLSNSIDARPLLCIVDPCLKDFLGHHYEYDRSVAGAASVAGFSPLILGHADVEEAIARSVPVRPCFSMDIWASGADSGSKSPAEWERHCNDVFYDELVAGLAGLVLADPAIVFGHMITARQLMGWARFADKFVRHGGPKLVLLLRYQASFYQGDLCRKAFRILERVAKHGSVRLTSDSARLAQQIRRYTDLPIEEVPIPHTTSLPESAPTIAGGGPSRPLHVVSLGNARDEKGFIEILEAIRLANGSGLQGRFVFTLQANDAQPDVRAAIDRFAALGLPGVRLIDAALSSDSYYDLLGAADLVLTPYWRSIYEARTSGVFLEAVAAGKPVICTADTWMSDQLKLGGAGILCRDRDARDVLRALVAAADGYDALHDQAQRTRVGYVAHHNAAALVARISAPGPSPRRTPGPPRVAVLYPWGDAISGNSGASRRLKLLLDFLQMHGVEIRVLQAGRQIGALSPRVSVEAYQTEPPNQTFRRGRVLRLLSWLGVSSKGAPHFWWHVAAVFDRGLRDHIRELARWADVVMLEYTYWAVVTESECRAVGVPWICTDYDIVSDQIESPLLRRITQWLEFRALARADRAVMVAVDDQRRAAKRGIEAELIPNPVDAATLMQALPIDLSAILAEVYDIDLRGRQVCLFVGSNFEPNLIAVERIRETARAVASRDPASTALFVVAGGCAEPVRDGNFWALGKVDEVVLHGLYDHAGLVLVPLPFGTGASLKTVEALASGRPVVGTTVGFRGLAVTSGRDCVVEDDLAAYPDLVTSLLADAPRRAALGLAGRAFAQDYDFRRVFERYLPLLGLPLDGVTGESLALHGGSLTPELALQVARKARERAQWRHVDALAAFALQREPDNAEALFLKGECLAVADPPDRGAFAFYDRAIDAGGDPLTARLARARLHRRLGDSDAADCDEEQAVEGWVRSQPADPDFRACRRTLWALFHANDLNNVARMSGSILQHQPGPVHPDIHYLRAQAIDAQGADPQEAIAHYSAALALGGDGYWARNWIVSHRDRLSNVIAVPAAAAPDATPDPEAAAAELPTESEAIEDVPPVLLATVVAPPVESESPGTKVHGMNPLLRKWSTLKLAIFNMVQLPDLLEATANRSEVTAVRQLAMAEERTTRRTDALSDRIDALSQRLDDILAQLAKMEPKGRSDPQTELRLTRLQAEALQIQADLSKGFDGASDRLDEMSGWLGEIPPRLGTVTEGVSDLRKRLEVTEAKIERQLAQHTGLHQRAESRHDAQEERLLGSIQRAHAAALGAQKSRLIDRVGQFVVRTDTPVAYDSPDHQVPWGTARDNSCKPSFTAKLVSLLPAERASVLDLGCSGGGQVRDFIENGYFAVGIEGSDYSLRRVRAEWQTIPEFLFTADITKPFTVAKAASGETIRFGAVTLWEVIEHIRREDLGALMSNIDAHLMPGGIVIMSVSPNVEEIEGVALHQTVEQRDWWLDCFDGLGWKNHPALVDYFSGTFVRGEPDAPNSFHLVLARAGEDTVVADKVRPLLTGGR